MCYATLDTDAIGSCRLPAPCCGVVGFKGTYCLISSEGILAGEKADDLILWLSHPGITARRVEDVALMSEALAEQKKKKTKSFDFVSGLTKDRKLRIGVANNFNADQEVSKSFEKAVEIIHSLGHSMSSTAAPFFNIGQGINNIEADRRAITGQAFKSIDVLILATTTTTVPAIKDAAANPQALSPENTAFANYYGLPAITVPCGFDPKGLPLGLQIVGKLWDEPAVLRLAYQYQEATGYSTKHPPDKATTLNRTD